MSRRYKVLARQYGKPTHIVSRRVVAMRYTQSCGRCNVPPWEECECSGFLNEQPSVAEQINAEAQHYLQLALA